MAKKKDKSAKDHIASQNPGTNVAAINVNDTRPYEQKNINKGVFEKNL